MTKQQLRIALVCTLWALALPGQALAQGEAWEKGRVSFSGPNGEVLSALRCGTPQPTGAQTLATGAVTEAYLQSRTASLVPLTIPVVFHIIRHNDGTTANVPDAQITDQLAVLNAAFLAHGYQFSLLSIERINNTVWSTVTYDDPPSAIELAMKAALAVTPKCVLNIYSGDVQDALGWATFPDSYAEADTRHGVIIRYDGFPGGTGGPYDEGDTATHEVGHYLGLYHTFEGGCSAPGDSVADTPQEADETYGCPVGQDSCPADPGDDPIENFMDYTDDSCMDEFTAGQGTRMNAQVAAFKPSLGSQLCESVKPVPALSPRGLVIALVLLAATLAAVRRVATR